MSPNEVKDHPEAQQFELHSDGQLAYLQYQRLGSQIILIHTVVPPQLEGKGIGSALAKAGLDFARQNQLRVVPLCPFVKSYLQRHPEYQDLVKGPSE